MPKSRRQPVSADTLNWKDKRLTIALQLAFEGRWTHDEMADKVGVSTRTIERWVAHTDFQQHLEAQSADFAASIRDVVYADKGRRIIALSQLAEQARRQYEEHELLIEVRPTKDGEITIERFNTDAHTAARGAMDDIAKELGHRVAKTDASAQIALIAVAADVLDAV